ncbi:MAG: hypothetical protein R3E64_08640 [Halioglobus sp.]
MRRSVVDLGDPYAGLATGFRIPTVKSLSHVERERGVALAIVIWFIAGMSLLVAGIVAQAKVDTRMAQLHVSRAKAIAAGDGAIQLMLAERLLTSGEERGKGNMLAGNYRLGSSDISVSLMPAAGFVDLNAAPQPVLAALFLIVGRVSEEEANFLANNMVKWRNSFPDQDKNLTGSRKFKTIEDLLRIQGMSRTLFDAVRNFIVVGSGSGTATDWALVPEELLQVLDKANPGELDNIRDRREKMAQAAAAPAGDDSSPGAGQSLSGVYRADAKIVYGDKTWLRRRWVAIGSVPGTALPWHFVRSEPLRVYQPSNGIR